MRTCFSITLICLLAGCGRQPEFSHRAQFDDLTPYAQDYVQQVLDQYFGQPTDMVVWERLPLHDHTAIGTVEINVPVDSQTAGEESDADAEPSAAPAPEPISLRKLKLALTEKNIDIRPGTEILWTGGENGSPSSSWVRSWDEEDQEVDLESAVSVQNGDELIVGPGEVLVQGRLLYAEHCQHCHGVAGDGNGPTAQYLNPRPRDYRLGIFKFKTTQPESRAAREDLVRIVEDGIPGTYMPSFKLLTKDEMTSIIEYVLWLSMRGELEFQLVSLLTDEGYSSTAVNERVKSGEKRAEIQNEFIKRVADPDDFPTEVETFVGRYVAAWEASQEEPALIQPLTPRVPYSAESIAKGRQLYLNESLKCAQCHGEAAYGNGIQTVEVMKDANQQEYPVPGLHDDWGNPIKPRNLHTGIFRGGRRPIDLYSRVYAGIKGTPMPPFKNLVRPRDPNDPNSPLTDEDIWHLVNYLYSIPIDGFEPVRNPGDPAAADPVKNEVAATN